jgi:hypothetical protein
MALDMLDSNETMRVRDTSPNNPINMDILGELTAVNRDFAQVPELTMLLRQDFAARAGIPQSLILENPTAAFSSDSTSGDMEKQLESVKYIHKEVEGQLVNIAKLCVINALGIGRDVMAALPYTTIEFSNPKLSNATAKADVASKILKGFFDTVAAGMPLDAALEIAQEFSDDEFKVDNDLMEQLKERQAVLDQRAEEEHDLNMAVLEAQVDKTEEEAKHVGDAPAGASGAKKPAAKKGKTKDGNSYLDRLKQHAMERVAKKDGSGTKKQGLTKAQNKIQTT